MAFTYDVRVGVRDPHWIIAESRGNSMWFDCNFAGSLAFLILMGRLSVVTWNEFQAADAEFYNFLDY